MVRKKEMTEMISLKPVVPKKQQIKKKIPD